MSLDRLSRLALYTLLVWSPLAIGANRPWPLAILQLLVVLALVLWVLRMAGEGRLEWRRSAVDLPLLLLIALVAVQLLLGNRPLATWALAPPPSALDVPATFPTTFLTLGTVAPAHTASSLLLFLTYAGVYVLVLNVIRTRAQLERLVITLVSFGGVFAFCGLLDHLAGNAWLLQWRDIPLAGRLAGTFGNPDHLAAWLNMVVCLGLGALAARLDGAEAGFGSLLRSREQREAAVRRYLPFVGLVVMVLALVFTLSRGGVLSLAVTFVMLLVLLSRLRMIRWSFAVIGALVVVVLGYATWIGLDPLLARVRHADYTTRWVLVITTLPMLRSFPLLGVGLGAYGDTYVHYQPAVLQPGKIDPQYAHNDLLQLVVELGLVGAVIVTVMVWRVAKDLVVAHLLGSSRCPVGGGEEEGARRHDPFSVGLAVGAVGGVFTLLVHSAYDFSARIPANGVLAATCLGIATVALHTRFTIGRERLLTAVRVYTVSSRFVRRAMVPVAVVLSLLLVGWIIRPPLVASKLQEAARAAIPRAEALRHADAAVAIASRDERARELRARLRLAAGLETWNLGRTLDGRILVSWEDRQGAAVPLVRGAIEDLRTAVSAVPVNSFAHESLARAYWTLAVLDAQNASQHLAQALTFFSRAVASAPQSPLPYRALAVFAVHQPGLTEIGLRAARSAVERDPPVLAGLVEDFLPQRLTANQWIAAVPESVIDRLELGALLERRQLLSEAAEVYRRAVEIAPVSDSALARWRLARLLVRQGHGRDAISELEVALKQDPANPELHLERARAFETVGDVAALHAYRLAVLNAEVLERRPADERAIFGTLPARARTLVSEATSGKPVVAAARYREPLARYLNDRKLWAEALEQWDLMVEEAPTNATAHFGRGVALDGLGSRDASLDAYRKAVALNGTDVAVRLRLAQRLWETDQFYQAINEWRAILARAPGNVEARLSLARAYVRTGNSREASVEYQRLLHIAPDRPEVRQELARLGRGAPGPASR